MYFTAMQILTTREVRMVACVVMAAVVGFGVQFWRGRLALLPVVEEAVSR